MSIWSLTFNEDTLEVVDVGRDKITYTYINVVTWKYAAAGVPKRVPEVPCPPALQKFVKKYYLQCELPKNYFNPLLTK